jgi:hypothetical protein
MEVVACLHSSVPNYPGDYELHYPGYQRQPVPIPFQTWRDGRFYEIWFPCSIREISSWASHISFLAKLDDNTFKMLTSTLDKPVFISATTQPGVRLDLEDDKDFHCFIYSLIAMDFSGE